MYFPVCLWLVAVAIALSAVGPIRIFQRAKGAGSKPGQNAAQKSVEGQPTGAQSEKSVLVPMLWATVIASLCFIVVSPLRDGVDVDIAVLFLCAACALIAGEICGTRMWESVPRMLPRMATVGAEVGCAALCIGAMVVGTGRWHVAELHRGQAASITGLQGWYLFTVPAAPWLLVLTLILIAMRARACQRWSGFVPSLFSWGYCALMSGVVTLLFLGGWCGLGGAEGDSVLSRSIGMILFFGKMWGFLASAVVLGKALPLPGPRGWGDVDRRLILAAATVGFVVSCVIGPMTDAWGGAIAALSAFVCAVTVISVARGVVSSRGPRSASARVVRMNPVI